MTQEEQENLLTTMESEDATPSLGLRYWTGKRHRVYVCTTYAHNTKACTDHRIFYDDLYDAVLADIQYHAQLAHEDRDKAVALAIRMNDKAEGSRA